MIGRASLFVLVLAIAGCHQVVELDPWADGARDEDAGDALSCAAQGDECGPDRACCAGLCGEADRCRSTRCEAIGGGCRDSLDCCSASCVEGVCRSSGVCAPVGEGCTTSEQCCSRACAGDGSGSVVCQPLGGCLAAGEVCRTDDECCSDQPGACVVVDAAIGVGRCAGAAGCAAAGEICRVAGDPLAARECCPEGPVGRSLCRPTSIGDLDRCATERASVSCLAEGEPCATPDECCGGICSPEDGALACRAGCRRAGASCTRTVDCCEGDCESGACQDTVRTCAPLGAACADASSCCSGVCSATSATCASPLI